MSVPDPSKLRTIPNRQGWEKQVCQRKFEQQTTDSYYWTEQARQRKSVPTDNKHLEGASVIPQVRSAHNRQKVRQRKCDQHTTDSKCGSASSISTQHTASAAAQVRSTHNRQQVWQRKCDQHTTDSKCGSASSISTQHAPSGAAHKRQRSNEQVC
jgi:hypothetical protein